MIYKIAKGILWIFASIWYQVEIEGWENLPESGPYVLCSNHVSYADPVMLAFLAKKEPVHFIAKKELFQNPLLGWFFKKLNAFPVDRENASLSTMRHAMSVLQNKGILGIFPEGTRAKGRKLKPQGGYVVFAHKAKAPIVPVLVHYDSFKFRAKIKVVVGKPVYLTNYTSKRLKIEEISEISQKIMDNIYDLH